MSKIVIYGLDDKGNYKTVYRFKSDKHLVDHYERLRNLVRSFAPLPKSDEMTLNDIASTLVGKDHKIEYTYENS